MVSYTCIMVSYSWSSWYSWYILCIRASYKCARCLNIWGALQLQIAQNVRTLCGYQCVPFIIPTRTFALQPLSWTSRVANLSVLPLHSFLLTCLVKHASLIKPANICDFVPKVRLHLQISFMLHAGEKERRVLAIIVNIQGTYSGCRSPLVITVTQAYLTRHDKILTLSSGNICQNYWFKPE